MSATHIVISTIALTILTPGIVVAQDQVSEVYLYGHALGTVTVDDIATDGHVITLKGIQYWPRLTAAPPPPRVARDAERDAKRELRDSVSALHREMQQQGLPVSAIRAAMVDLMRRSPLVRDVREPDDPDAGYFEYRLVDDPGEDWQILHGIGFVSERPTHEERLNSELNGLRKLIARGYLIIDFSGARACISNCVSSHGVKSPTRRIPWPRKENRISSTRSLRS